MIRKTNKKKRKRGKGKDLVLKAKCITSAIFWALVDPNKIWKIVSLKCTKEFQVSKRKYIGETCTDIKKNSEIINNKTD